MKIFDRRRQSSVAAAFTGISSERRKLLLLGLALAGITFTRRTLRQPPLTTGQALRDSGLSRHEAAFYSTRGIGD